jgi:hypothetical protein
MPPRFESASNPRILNLPKRAYGAISETRRLVSPVAFRCAQPSHRLLQQLAEEINIGGCPAETVRTYTMYRPYKFCRRRCTHSPRRSSSDRRTAGRPRQQGVAVEVGARHRIRQVLAFDIDLKSLKHGEVHAGRHPLEGTRDRGPARNLGALRALGLITRGVIPVDVGAESPLS